MEYKLTNIDKSSVCSKSMQVFQPQQKLHIKKMQPVFHKLDFSFYTVNVF